MNKNAFNGNTVKWTAQSKLKIHQSTASLSTIENKVVCMPPIVNEPNKKMQSTKTW